jgi:hypothetical protein
MAPSDPLRPSARVTIDLHPARLGRLVIVAAAIVMALSVASVVAWEVLDVHGTRRLDADEEGSVPAWLQSSLLLASALLWEVMARREGTERRSARAWRLLAFVFALASLDETIAAHEWLIDPLREAIGASGVLYYSWVLPGAVAAAVVAAVVLRPVFALPAAIRWRLIAAAALYLGGALGFELVGGALADDGSSSGLTYRLATQVEEALEITGVVLVVLTLLRLLASVEHGADTEDRERILRTVPVPDDAAR